ncbi:hypothetical protein AVEN_166980-1 [Araneus ventricosus]|uniref:Transposase Tc1-like domain-containing protein n=1 Tax=Araneus ventricosus TaxID=182803 RepID=A0A4Y2H0A4_ARAVE|nr:hypothetical protein AVEN_166980-1 [Araneus ventricosus]
MGLRSRRLVNAPMLTAVHRRRRLEFERCHTARSVCAWFEEHQDEFTVPPLASKLTGFKPNRESVGPPRSGCLRHGSSTA